MKLTNKTNIPNELVRELIRFVKPSGLKGSFDVSLGNRTSTCFTGRAWPQGMRIFVGVGNRDRLPARAAHPAGGYLPTPAVTRHERLLMVLAHELRHLWQGQTAKGKRRRAGMVWGARGKFSERDADAYALRKLRHWRRK
jgi:hypothetical protein